MLTLLAFSVILVGRLDVTQSQATNIADAFRMYAAKATGQTIVGSTPAASPTAVDSTTEASIFNIKYDDGWVDVRKSDGKIVNFRLYDRSSNDETWNAGAALTNSQLTTLAQAYRSQAGFSGTTSLVEVMEQHEGPTMYFDVELARTVSGVPYVSIHGSFFEVSHTTGRLLAMELYDVPTAPQSLTPSVTLSQAHATLAAYLYSAHGISTTADLETGKLGIWKPVSEIPEGPDNFLEDTHTAMAANDEGLLVYDLYVESRDTFLSGIGVYVPRFAAFVDAQNGNLLVVYKYNPFGGGGKAQETLVSPDLGKGPLEITDVKSKRTLRMAQADLLPDKPPKADVIGRKAIIRRGKLSLVVWIDASTGKIWTQKKKIRKYAKLDDTTFGRYKRLLKS